MTGEDGKASDGAGELPAKVKLTVWKTPDGVSVSIGEMRVCGPAIYFNSRVLWRFVVSKSTLFEALERDAQ